MAGNIQARKKLAALYAKGLEVRFGPDPNGNPKISMPDNFEGPVSEPPGPDDIQMWVQPPSPLQREEAMRAAQAARAKALVRAKREKDSEEHNTIMAFLADMSDETLIEYVLLQDRDSRKADAMREVLGEDEWKDMASFQDIARSYDEDERSLEELEADPEYQAFMELDIEFGRQVSAREQELMDSQRESLKFQLETGRGNVEQKALKHRAELVGTQAFMYEYELQMRYFSVRQFDDHGLLFFTNPRECAEAPDEVKNAITEALANFISESGEAKNLQGVVSGLGSSEPPAGQETSESSIRPTAIV